MKALDHDFVSHIDIVPPYPAEANAVESGENATDQMPLPCFKVSKGTRADTSQMHTVSSEDPEANQRLFEEKATDHTLLVCCSRMATARLEIVAGEASLTLTFHSRTVPSFELDASNPPSREKVTPVTALACPFRFQSNVLDEDSHTCTCPL